MCVDIISDGWYSATKCVSKSGEMFQRFQDIV